MCEYEFIVILKLALTLAFILLFIFLLKKKRQMIFMVPNLTAYFFVMLGTMLIENGFFVTEQLQYGYQNGSFYIFLLYALATMITFYFLADRIIMKVRYINNSKLYWVLTIIQFSVVAYILRINPEVSRLNFFDALGGLQRFYSWIYVVYNILFIYVIYKLDRMKMKFLVFLSYVLLHILMKVEFGTFFFSITTMYAAYLIFINSNSKFGMSLRDRRKYTYVLLSFLALTASYKISRLSFVSYESLAIFNRFVNSGQVFWGTVNYLRDMGTNLDFTGYISNFISFSVTSTAVDNGLGQLMVAVSPQEGPKYVAENIRFSGGYPAVLIFHFGYLVAFLLNILFTVMLVFVIKWQMYFLRHYNFLVFLVFIKLTVPITEFLIIGEYNMFNFKYILSMCLFVCVLFVHHILTRTQHNITPTQVSQA